MNKNKYDAILVLGIGTEIKLFKSRVEKAVSYYKKDYAKKIIFSGRWWGGLKKEPKKTEAQAMADYAIEIGLPKKDIFIEDQSLNTIGNFYFTKKNILEPKHIYNLLVITSPHHFSKARYIAQMILGKKFKLTFTGDGEPQKLTGHTGIQGIKKYFKNIKRGNDKDILKSFENHPYYKDKDIYKIIPREVIKIIKKADIK